ncbi:hypothetical protein [Sunxiuqinia rutila]|uniref:hypothetical protein n=1 Tax=Sunxiuqinia rutila TaxID=1397841 RepID=UPI003D36A2BC
MKQHTTPIIISDSGIQKLDRISLNSKVYNEDWIQEICFQSPNLLPFEEIEPIFNGMIPICRELLVESGSVDLIFINESGFITIGECKLWRNPEARRKVIGQILDYAKDIAKWNYSKFEQECLKARKGNEKSLFDLVQNFCPDIEESSFIDNIQKNLSKGRFLLTLIGDGIRENMEELVKYIHREGNLNFTLALIEIPVFENQKNSEIIVTPRILAKTKEIERIVYKLSDDIQPDEIEHQKEENTSKTISEKVYFERLQKSIGKDQTKSFQTFIETLKTELNIIPKLGRGKTVSLNLKSANGIYNFASIQETGEVWFYGIVYNTELIGDKSIGVDYLKKLANIVNGEFFDTYKVWNWCVKKNGMYINITEYLKHQREWVNLISETLEKINRLEEDN